MHGHAPGGRLRRSARIHCAGRPRIFADLLFHKLRVGHLRRIRGWSQDRAHAGGGEPGRCGIAKVGAMTAPEVIRRILQQARADGVEMDVAHHGQELNVALHLRGVEAALEEVSAVRPAVVEAAGIAGADRVHQNGERPVIRLQQQMDMVRHQAVGVEALTTLLKGACHTAEVPTPILVVDEDGPAVVATLGDMEEGIRDVRSWRSSHGPKYRPAWSGELNLGCATTIEDRHQWEKKMEVPGTFRSRSRCVQRADSLVTAACAVDSQADKLHPRPGKTQHFRVATTKYRGKPYARHECKSGGNTVSARGRPLPTGVGRVGPPAPGGGDVVFPLGAQALPERRRAAQLAVPLLLRPQPGHGQQRRHGSDPRLRSRAQERQVRRRSST